MKPEKIFPKRIFFRFQKENEASLFQKSRSVTDEIISHDVKLPGFHRTFLNTRLNQPCVDRIFFRRPCERRTVLKKHPSELFALHVMVLSKSRSGLPFSMSLSGRGWVTRLHTTSKSPGFMISSRNNHETNVWFQ